MRFTHIRTAFLVAAIGGGLFGSTALAIEYVDGVGGSGQVQQTRPGNKPEPNEPAGRSGGQTAKPGGQGDKPGGAAEKPQAEKNNAGSADDRGKEKQNDPAGDNGKGQGAGADRTAAGNTPKQAAPKGGNAGAIFVKTGPTTGPGNTPHVGCDFYISGMNFSSPSGTIAFYAWKPTGSFESVVPVAGSSTYSGDAPSKQAGGANNDFLNGPYSLPTEGQTPHAKQGYHYKVDAIDADGKKVDSKVFWVNCQPSSIAPSTPTPTSTGTIIVSTGTSTPTSTGTIIVTTGTSTPTPTVAIGSTSTGTPTSVAGITVLTGTITVTLTMPIIVEGPDGPVILPAGTRITLEPGVALTVLPSATSPAPQYVEVAPGSVLGTVEYGSVTSGDEAIGEVVLGEAALAEIVVASALPRTGGAPFGAFVGLGILAVLGGIAIRRWAVW